MSSESYHEPLEQLSERTRNLHRGVVSLIEELEAIDWYQQRAEACSDEELRRVLLHNRDEEIEHAVMTLEWLRRNEPQFDKQLREILFAEGTIVKPELHASDGAEPKVASDAGSLAIGSLKGAR